MQIRPAAPRDYDTIERILSQHLFPDSASDMHVPLTKVVSQKSEPFSVVAEDSEEVLGTTSIYIVDSPETLVNDFLKGATVPDVRNFSEQRIGYLCYAYVDKEYLQSGLGSEMLERLLDYAKESDSDLACAEVWIYHEEQDGRAVLENHGFEPVFWPQDYWGSNSFCSYHETEQCDCTGAIYTRNL